MVLRNIFLAIMSLIFVASTTIGITFQSWADRDGDGKITANDKATAVAYYDNNLGALKGTRTPIPTRTRVPTKTATATKTPVSTKTSVPSPTSTPLVTQTTTPTPPPLESQISPFYYGSNMAQFQDTLNRVKNSLTGDLPLCDETDPNIHPKTKWHGLVYFNAINNNIVPVCHYSHAHGHDPNAGNDVFGLPNAFLGAPGQSVSSPAQTFVIPTFITDTNITPSGLEDMGIRVDYENDVKHTGYKWYVSTGSKCITDNPTLQEFAGRQCVTDFRMQMHIHSLIDFHVRYHSFTAEFRVCNDVNESGTCGIKRAAGWIDLNELFTPQKESRCFSEFNKEIVDGLIPLPSTTQFFPSNRDTDTRPFDEFRCHWRLTASDVVSNPNGFPAIPEHFPFEWWGLGLNDIRLQFFVANPITGVGSNGIAEKPYCQQVLEAYPAEAVNCRMTGQKIHVNSGYILPTFPYGTYYFVDGKNINASNDTDGDGILDSQHYLTRFGNIQPEGFCTGISLDCLPETWDGNFAVPFTKAQVAQGCNPQNYVDMGCRPMQGAKDIRPSNVDNTVDIIDMDITPKGIKSWISEVWGSTHVH